MKQELQHGDAIVSVEAEGGSGEVVRARVAVRRQGEESGERARSVAVSITPLGDDRFLLQEGTRVREARIERGAPGSTSRRVVFAEGALNFDRVDPLGAAGRRARPASGPATVVSPMPGRVVSLAVELGQDVVEGAPVVVVEAMKMANELRAPCAGRVTAIHVAAGAKVEAGMPLLVVTPPPAEAS